MAEAGLLKSFLAEGGAYKKGDTFKDQFWSMFQLFGAHMQLCMEAPFDSYQIILHTT